MIVDALSLCTCRLGRYLGLVDVIFFRQSANVFSNTQNTMAKWFIIDEDGYKYGPFDGQKIKALAQQGKITPDTLLASDAGHKSKAGQIPGLFNDKPPVASADTQRVLINQTIPQSAQVPKKSIANVITDTMMDITDTVMDQKWILYVGLLFLIFVGIVFAVKNTTAEKQKEQEAATILEVEQKREEEERQRLAAIARAEQEQKEVAEQKERAEREKSENIRRAVAERLARVYTFFAEAELKLEEFERGLSQDAIGNTEWSMQKEWSILKNWKIHFGYSEQVLLIAVAELTPTEKREIMLKLLEAVAWRADESSRAERSIYGGSPYIAGSFPPQHSTIDNILNRAGLRASEKLSALEVTHPKPSDNTVREVLNLVEIQKSAEQGDADAQYFLGLSFVTVENIVEADKWLRKSAEQGHRESQFMIGIFYITGGSGFNKDKDEGVKWLRKAAEQGNEAAIIRLQQMGIE